MDTKHTPGPWDLAQGENEITVYTDATIATVPDSLESWEANARLIAAAPDLLAALELISQGPDEFDHSADIWEELEGCRRVARKAIAKATGSSNV